MTFRIRTVDRTANGREIVRERMVASDEIVIGRAAENAIHLPDLAVEQQHVRVALEGEDRLRLQALGSLGFGLDGRSADDIAIDPDQGAELELGSYRLEFARARDGVVEITVRKAGDQPGDKAEALAGFSLAGVLPGKRGLA